MNINISFSDMSSSTMRIIGMHKSKSRQSVDGSLVNSTVGQIYMELFTLYITDSFIHGKSRPQKTFITMAHSNLYASNSTFWKNRELGNGPSVINATGFNRVLIKNSIFVANKASKGTILISNNSYISMSNCLIAENTVPMSKFNYSTITVIANSSALFTASKLLQNKAFKGGVILGVYRTSVSIVRSIVKDNEACFGGGITLESNSLLTIVDSRIVQNSAYPSQGYIDLLCSGGAFFGRISKVVIQDCQIGNNTAKYDSGAIDIQDTSELIITHCTLSENRAGYYGGAVNILIYSSAIIRHSSFIKNQALQKGAIGINFHSRMAVEDSIFSENSAYQYVGAVSAVGYCRVVMTRCRFVKNTASDQTGAYGAQGYTDTEMNNCIFDRNTALRNVGTALIHKHCSLLMRNCTIMNSQSTQCTIAFGQNVNGEIINGGFINNTSTMACKCPFLFILNPYC